MKKLQISKEHRELIESVVKENAKYKGHEYLMNSFCDAIYKKSYLLIDAIRDMSRLRRHLTMISDSCMDAIIKEKRKFDDKRLYNEIIQKSKYNSEIVSLKKSNKPQPDIKEQVSSIKNPEVVNLKEEIQRSEKYDSVYNLKDPIEQFPVKKVSSNTIERLIQIVKKIDKQYPNKRYYEIFSLRYIKKFNQTDTARSLNISQIELSKRFVELITATKDNVF